MDTLPASSISCDEDKPSVLQGVDRNPKRGDALPLVAFDIYRFHSSPCWKARGKREHVAGKAIEQEANRDDRAHVEAHEHQRGAKRAWVRHGDHPRGGGRGVRVPESAREDLVAR
jgi:hypothetical protein